VHPARWHADYASLKRELETETFAALLRVVRRENPRLSEVEAWRDLLIPEGGNVEPESRTAVALSVVHATHRHDENPLWVTVLLALFWVPLLYLWRKELRSGVDEDDLWTAISEAFLEAVATVRRDEPEGGFPKALWWETRNQLRTAMRREWRRGKREVPMLVRDRDEEDMPPQPEVPDLNASRAFRDVEDRIDREKKVRELRDCLLRGLLTELEHDVLMGVEIYGQTLVEYAERAGSKYEAVRKRYQRARAKVTLARERMSRRTEAPASSDQEGTTPGGS
jgi:RNA polymerase sigma factor (sigma-70 family)